VVNGFIGCSRFRLKSFEEVGQKVSQSTAKTAIDNEEQKDGGEYNPGSSPENGHQTKGQPNRYHSP